MVGLLRPLRLDPLPPCWLVCFADRRGDVTLAGRLMAPGYRHVFLYGHYADIDAWVLVDPAPAGVRVELHRGRVATATFAVIAGETVTEALVVPSRPVRRRRRLPVLYSCAVAVASMLGIEPVPWLTPRRLARELLKRPDVKPFAGF